MDHALFALCTRMWSRTCRAAMATRAAMGLPPYVLPCSPRPIVSITCARPKGVSTPTLQHLLPNRLPLIKARSPCRGTKDDHCISGQTWRVYSWSERAACSSTGWAPPRRRPAPRTPGTPRRSAPCPAPAGPVAPAQCGGRGAVTGCQQRRTMPAEVQSCSKRMHASSRQAGPSSRHDSATCVPSAAGRMVVHFELQLHTAACVIGRQRTGSWSQASILPVRAHPVCTSSAMSSARCRCSSSCACFRYPWSGTTTPASPCMQQVWRDGESQAKVTHLGDPWKHFTPISMPHCTPPLFHHMWEVEPARSTTPAGGSRPAHASTNLYRLDHEGDDVGVRLQLRLQSAEVIVRNDLQTCQSVAGLHDGIPSPSWVLGVQQLRHAVQATAGSMQRRGSWIEPWTAPWKAPRSRAWRGQSPRRTRGLWRRTPPPGCAPRSCSRQTAPSPGCAARPSHRSPTACRRRKSLWIQRHSVTALAIAAHQHCPMPCTNCSLPQTCTNYSLPHPGNPGCGYSGPGWPSKRPADPENQRRRSPPALKPWEPPHLASLMADSPPSTPVFMGSTLS